MQDPTEKQVSDVGILDKYNYYYYKTSRKLYELSPDSTLQYRNFC
jgi:hypothetical protein